MTELPPPPPGRTGWPWTAAPDPLPGAAADWPRVTVVTPSFNQAAFLEEAIRSVLRQGYPNLEYIVLDGGSTDGSVEIIRRYAPWLTHWASAPDKGQADALRRGFERATGEVLAWLNSDDVYLPGALRQAVAVLRDTPEAVMVFGDADQIGRAGEPLGPARQVGPVSRESLLKDNNAIAQPAAFFRRAAYEAAGGLETALHWAMDYDLWIRLSAMGPLAYTPSRLAQMRLYPEAKTGRGDQAMFREILEVVRRHGGDGLPTEMSAWLEAMQLPRALDAYRHGDREAGRAGLAFLVEMMPDWRDEQRLGVMIAGEAWRMMADGTLNDQDGPNWAAAMCAGLPTAYTSPDRVRQVTLGLVHEALAFREARRGRTGAALRHASRAVRHDARRLCNRGLWAATLRAALRLGNEPSRRSTR